MALSVEVAMREWRRYCDVGAYDDDVLDTEEESDGEEELEFAPVAAAVMVGSKRTYGVFHESPLGWMVHANVMTSTDPVAIWGDEHAGHDMQQGMKHDMHYQTHH